MLISLFSRDSYPKHAYREPPVKANRCQYVVYGHTHDQVVIPLDIVPSEEGAMRKIYFNTGTWRKTHTRTSFDRESREFIGWHVLTHISFYRSDEAEGRQQFEVWNGALGVRS